MGPVVGDGSGSAAAAGASDFDDVNDNPFGGGVADVDYEVDDYGNYAGAGWNGKGALLGDGLAPPLYDERYDDGGGGDDGYGPGFSRRGRSEQPSGPYDELPEGIFPRSNARRRQEADEAAEDYRLEKELVGGGVYSPKKRRQGQNRAGMGEGRVRIDENGDAALVRRRRGWGAGDDDEEEGDELPPAYSATARLGETLLGGGEGVNPYTGVVDNPRPKTAFEKLPAAYLNDPDGSKGAAERREALLHGRRPRGAEANLEDAAAAADSEEFLEGRLEVGGDGEAARLMRRQRDLTALIDELEDAMDHSEETNAALSAEGRAAGRADSNAEVLELLRQERQEVRGKLRARLARRGAEKEFAEELGDQLGGGGGDGDRNELYGGGMYRNKLQLPDPPRCCRRAL